MIAIGSCLMTATWLMKVYVPNITSSSNDIETFVESDSHLDRRFAT